MQEQQGPVRVVAWICYDNVGYDENDLGGIGGWVEGESFDEYLLDVAPHMRGHAEALRQAILARGLKYTGHDHQNRDDGVPLFSDDTVSQFSFRAWGDIMAAVWNTAEDTRRYGYMDFYM